MVAVDQHSNKQSGANQHRLLDRVFDISILLKGIDGLLEVVGGILLLVISPDTLNALTVWLTQHELSQDPKDFIANHLLHFSGNLHHTQFFGGIYLLSHGLVKIVLVVALLKQQRWAYPVTLVFLVTFITYQCYRLTYDPTVSLVLLTLFDAFIVWLVWREWQVHRKRWSTEKKSSAGD